MSKGNVLRALVSHLSEAKDLAKQAASDFSFVSEIDHLLKVALFNLDEETRGKGPM